MCVPGRVELDVTCPKILVDTYGHSAIADLTFNEAPFLLSSEALVFSQDRSSFNEIMAISMVTKKDCAGHFGPRLAGGLSNLRVPLLYFLRIMSITSQIAARRMYPELVPVLVGGENICINSPDLLSPPVVVIGSASGFRTIERQFFTNADISSRGNQVAIARNLAFELVQEEKFADRRIACSNCDFPDELMLGCSIEEEMYRSEIENLIMERVPFHRLDRAILLKPDDGGVRVITISNIAEPDCAGQLLFDGQPTLTILDYFRLMALTTELLASIAIGERDSLIIPVVVQVEKISTPNLVLLLQPTTVIVSAVISAESIDNYNRVGNNEALLLVDHVAIFVGGVEVARMNNITCKLIQGKTLGFI